MAPEGSRRRRCLVPFLTILESRRMLAFSVTGASQDGMDIVGPNASPGPDGIQDLDLKLAGLSASYAVNYITVAPSGGVVTGSYPWETAPDTNGYSLAEFFQTPTNQTTGDLYINPQVNAVAAPPGSGSLGGSTGTGSLVDLQNGDSLTVTVYYNGTTPSSFTFQLGGSVGSLTSPHRPRTPELHRTSTRGHWHVFRGR